MMRAFTFRCSKLWTVLICLTLFAAIACADDTDSKAWYYIDQYKFIAVEEMERMGVPASIKLAQGMLESSYGESRLATEGRNHFGIKCKNYWKGDTITITDDAPDECFRRYPSVHDSYIDHSYFLHYHRTGHYAHLFRLEKTNYKAWATGLKKAGYATAPHYANILVKLIERYKLYEFDRMTVADLYRNSTTVYRPPDLGKTDELSANYPKAGSRSPYRPTAKPSQTPDNEDATFFTPGGEQASNTDASASTPSVEIEKPTLKRQKINERFAIKANFDMMPAYAASMLKLSIKDVYKFNDLQAGDEITAGEPIFLEQKKKKVPRKGKTRHKVLEGESMHDIAQKYGIRLKSLYKHNKMKRGSKAPSGKWIWLR